MSIIVGAVRYLGGYDNIQQVFIQDLGFAIATLVCISLIFAPKAYLIAIGAEINHQMTIVSAKFKVAGSLEEKDDSLETLLTVESQKRNLRNGTVGKNRKLCEDQIAAGNHNIAVAGRIVSQAQQHITDWTAVKTAIEENDLDRIVGRGSVVYSNPNYNRYKRNSQSSVMKVSVVSTYA